LGWSCRHMGNVSGVWILVVPVNIDRSAARENGAGACNPRQDSAQAGFRDVEIKV
jgi:hypothetical protein